MGFNMKMCNKWYMKNEKKWNEREVIWDFIKREWLWWVELVKWEFGWKKL